MYIFTATLSPVLYYTTQYRVYMNSYYILIISFLLFNNLIYMICTYLISLILSEIYYFQSISFSSSITMVI